MQLIHVKVKDQQKQIQEEWKYSNDGHIVTYVTF
jgi:hypothetical protein